MSIDKKALFNLSSEPYLKPISNLGVGFYNLDENTAVLQFQLSNSKGPLLIHENNLTAYAYFESDNGSASDVVELEIKDSNNGIVEITLDTDFLQASTSTTVKGQVYIAVNNHDGDPTYNEVAVFREFTFEVADALINKISAFTKVENIRMFNQLKIHIEQRVNDIDAAIANGEDYVAQMNATLLNGKTQLNQIVADGTATIDGTVTQAKADITAKIDSATSEITTLSNNTKTDVQNTADNAITDITNTSNTATEHVDSKVTEFNQTVADNGFLSPQILDEELENLEWQKYKLTNDNGNANIIYDISMENIEEKITRPGYYWLSSVTNGPVNINGVLLAIHGASDSYKKFIYTPHNSNRVFLKSKNGSVWTDWEEIGNTQTDTGWIPYTLINGANANTAFKAGTDNSFDCAYRIIKNGSVAEKRVRINASNVTHLQQIAQLPINFAENVQFHYVRVPINSGYGLVSVFPSGEVYVYVETDKREEWLAEEDFYFYGEFSWKE